MCLLIEKYQNQASFAALTNLNKHFKVHEISPIWYRGYMKYKQNGNCQISKDILNLIIFFKF